MHQAFVYIQNKTKKNIYPTEGTNNANHVGRTFLQLCSDLPFQMNTEVPGSNNMTSLRTDLCIWRDVICPKLPSGSVHQIIKFSLHTYYMSKKSWPIFMASYYIKWAKTSWTYSISGLHLSWFLGFLFCYVKIVNKTQSELIREMAIEPT